MSEDDPQDFIKEIRKKLNDGEMSLFVGSGFSKNANSKFPLWDELLADMIDSLYPTVKYKKIRVKNRRDKNIRLDCRKDKIDEIGYLKIVDEYEKRAGIREAITCYIVFPAS